ncbi:MAG: pyrimidine reductase family protein [Microbacteriaceae bacterium]
MTDTSADGPIIRLLPGADTDSSAGTDAGPDDERILSWYAVPDRTVPWTRINFVASVDGSATHGGLSAGLGSSADKRVFDLLRRLCDVVVVGAGTVRDEGYGPMRLEPDAVAWRVEHDLAPHPVFAIVSGGLKLNPGSRIFTQAPVRPLVITSSAAPSDRRDALAAVADVLVCGAEHVDTVAMVDALVARGLPQILSEGGPRLFGSMVADGTVDELCLTISPLLEGGVGGRIIAGDQSLSERLKLQQVLTAGDSLILRYTR